MAKSKSGGNTRSMDNRPKQAAILNSSQGGFASDSGMYTPDWDNPNVQTARIPPRGVEKPPVDRGPSGLSKRGQ